MPRPFDVAFPRSRRRYRLALGASVVAHLLLLRFGVFHWWVPAITPPAEHAIVLTPLPAPGAEDIGRLAPRIARRRTAELPRVAAAPALPAPVRESTPVLLPAPPAAVTADSGGAGRVALRIAPGLARGKLWVEPLPLPPRELAARLLRSHGELVDSAVTATIQAFLDSVAADPASKAVTMPSWTTTIAGKKFGLDSRNIYIAGLKIPAAVLALLHLPPGNESKAFDRSGWLYDDLRYAAQRSANQEDFKRVIRETRERKEREREFDRNQRTTPPKENDQ